MLKRHKAPPRHAHAEAFLQLAAKSSFQDFFFCFTFKPHQKTRVAAGMGSGAAGWGRRCPGRVARWLWCFHPWVYLGEPGPPEKDKSPIAQLDSLREPAKDNLKLVVCACPKLLIEPTIARLPSPCPFLPRHIDSNHRRSQHRH